MGQGYSRGYTGAIILQVDTRDEKPAIKEVTGSVPLNMKVPRQQQRQAAYKFECMENPDAHPLDIRTDNYELITITSCAIDPMHDVNDRSYGNHYKFNQDEIEFIQSISRQPKVEWAIENSFDGLYIQKEFNHADFRTHYRFAVYLKEEQATFWKLKYHGS
jgi:hypothetical protein